VTRPFTMPPTHNVKLYDGWVSPVGRKPTKLLVEAARCGCRYYHNRETGGLAVRQCREHRGRRAKVWS